MKPNRRTPRRHSPAALASDAALMDEAIEQARAGLGCTRPNPAVGAVIARSGEVVGRGYHRFAGAPHAEVAAIADARGRVAGTTMYVTLEPCDHQGRTGPCTEELIRAGISRVVVGALDPNPQVRGRGLRRLRRAGIAVTTGVREAECQALNEGYFKHVVSGRPRVILKAATSLDGRLATRRGESRGLTGAVAHDHLHELRAACDAIVVGIGTVLEDDPRLTVRLRGHRRPNPDPLVRVVVDSHARTPTGARVVRAPGRVVIATTRGASTRRREQLERAGAEILVCRSRADRVSLRDLFRRLGDRGLMTVLVEGGGQIHGSLLRERLADCAAIYVAPRLIGGDGVPLASGPGRARLAHSRLVGPTWQPLGEDMLLTGRFR